MQKHRQQLRRSGITLDDRIQISREQRLGRREAVFEHQRELLAIERAAEPLGEERCRCRRQRGVRANGVLEVRPH